MRGQRNVLVAKDHGTTVEQDLALLQTAAMHLGASSGPGIMPTFGKRPYLMTNAANIVLEAYTGLSREGNFVRFGFAGPLQRYMIGQETTPLLIAEFERMWRAVNPEAWKEELFSQAASGGSQAAWLR